MSNTLSRTTDASTLAVGVNWNGNALNKSTPVTMIDTSNNISAGLDALAVATAFAGADRVSTQGNFDFTIDSATSDGSTAAEFKDLTDGYWSGDVRVQFNAVWTIESGVANTCPVRQGGLGLLIRMRHETESIIPLSLFIHRDALLPCD